MLIDDEELRHIFKVASEERLQKLDAGLLHLEQHPQDQANLEDLLREAHSLKGDANMLGVKDVGTLSHHIEDILGAVKRGEVTFSPELSDRLYNGLDAIKKLVHESVTGEPAGVNVFHMLAHLMGATTSVPAPEAPAVVDSAKTVSVPPSEIAAPEINAIAETEPLTDNFSETPETLELPEPLDPTSLDTPAEDLTEDPAEDPTGAITPAPAIAPTVADPVGLMPPQAAEKQISEWEGIRIHPQDIPVPDAASGPEPVEANTAGTYRIETIRVETQKLDALMTQAGELTVTKIRIAHRLSEVETLVSLWEEWSRDVFVNRFILDGVERGNNGNALKQVQNFHHRAEDRLEQLGSLLTRLRNAAYEDSARLDVVTNQLEEGIRTLRLLPLSTIFNLFPRMVRDLAKQQGKSINLVIEGAETRADKRILEDIKDPLMHMIRNAIDHGIELPEERQHLGKPPTATLYLRGYQTATSIVIEVSDDGRGLDLDSIKQTAVKRGLYRSEELATMTPSQVQSLIFAPGFSTRTFVTEVSGRGVGLDVVRTNVERLKGSIQVDSKLGRGSTFRVQLGTTLATAHVLIVEVNQTSYAIPVEFVETTLLIQPHEIFAIEGCETIVLEGQPVSIVSLTDLLELKADSHWFQDKTDNNAVKSDQLGNLSRQTAYACIILKVGEDRLGVRVDALLDEQDVVLKPQSKLLKRIRNVSGATILGTGEVCMVLNPQDLIKSVRRRPVTLALQALETKIQQKQTVLLVEDSITIRTQEKRILEGAGYDVVTAVDGLDGFNKLKSGRFDAIVSDVQMPNLDGLTLAAKVRQYKEYSEIPIILVTSLASDEDKRRGAEAGANAYIPKGTFDQKVLLDTLRRLI